MVISSYQKVESIEVPVYPPGDLLRIMDGDIYAMQDDA